MEEMAIEDAKLAITRRNELKKLYELPIFKEIFVDGFMRDEPARIAQAITNPEMQGDVDQRMLDEMLRASGHLNNYLQQIVRFGNNIETQLKEAEEERERSAQLSNIEMEVDPITGDEYPKED